MSRVKARQLSREACFHLQRSPVTQRSRIPLSVLRRKIILRLVTFASKRIISIIIERCLSESDLIIATSVPVRHCVAFKRHAFKQCLNKHAFSICLSRYVSRSSIDLTCRHRSPAAINLSVRNYQFQRYKHRACTINRDTRDVTVAKHDRLQILYTRVST